MSMYVLYVCMNVDLYMYCMWTYISVFVYVCMYVYACLSVCLSVSKHFISLKLLQFNMQFFSAYLSNCVCMFISFISLLLHTAPEHSPLKKNACRTRGTVPPREGDKSWSLVRGRVSEACIGDVMPACSLLDWLECPPLPLTGHSRYGVAFPIYKEVGAMLQCRQR